MSTKVIKDGNVTTTIMDLTNGVGGKSAEVNIYTLSIKYDNFNNIESRDLYGFKLK